MSEKIITILHSESFSYLDLCAILFSIMTWIYYMDETIVYPWLSGRVLDPRPRDCGFEPHWHHSIVSLSKSYLSLLSTESTQEVLHHITEKLLTCALRIKSNKQSIVF